MQDSEAEVAELKGALAQAVEDIEEQTAIVEDLRRDLGTNKEVLAYKAQIRNLQVGIVAFPRMLACLVKRRGL